MTKKNKILITGHNGFIGKNLIELMYRDAPVGGGTLYDLIKFQGNILDDDDYDNFPSKIDYVIHLAGKNKGTDEEIIKNNVLGTQKIINLCLNTGATLIFASTDYDRESSYKSSKDTCEALCKANAYLGLKSYILKIPKIFGPHCKPFYNSFATTLIHLEALETLDENLHLVSDMKEQVKIMHVHEVTSCISDIVDGIICIRPGECRVINYEHITGHVKITWREFIDILKFFRAEDDFDDLDLSYPVKDLYSCVKSTLNWYSREYAQLRHSNVDK